MTISKKIEEYREMRRTQLSMSKKKTGRVSAMIIAAPETEGSGTVMANAEIFATVAASLPAYCIRSFE